MESTIIISLVGGFLSIALGANAFLFRQMVSGLTKVEVGLAVLVSKHSDSKEDIAKVESEFYMLAKRVGKLEERVIKLEAELTKG